MSWPQKWRTCAVAQFLCVNAGLNPLFCEQPLLVVGRGLAMGQVLVTATAPVICRGGKTASARAWASAI
jgi:hypothetical protein